LPKPHGGKLIHRVLSGERRERPLEEAKELPKIVVSSELVRDIENIAYGVFSPLEGFLGQEDYLSVLDNKRLANDLPWTIPILLDVSRKEITGVDVEDDVVLSTEDDQPVAVMRIEEKYGFDKRELAQQVFGTTDVGHPGVAKAFNMKDLLLGGKIDLINELKDPFYKYRLKPIETRILFREKGWRTVVGFQTRNVPHLGHEYVQKTALTFVDGVFINPVIGRKKGGDFKDEVILETYEALINHYYLKDKAVLAVLETEMRYAGPYEAIFHAIVRKNFGCTHFIVGRDHAGVGKYYKPYAAQEIFDEFPDLGITPLFFKAFFYCKKCGGVGNERTCPHGEEYRINFSGTEIRETFLRGEKPPQQLMRPEVAEIVLQWKDPFVA